MKKKVVKILGAALLLGALFIPNTIASGKDEETSRTTLTPPPTRDFSDKEVVDGNDTIDEETSWTTLAPPTRDCFRTDVVDGKIYIFGRKLSKSYTINDETKVKFDTEVYDPSTDTWTSLGSLPVICHPFTTEVVNGKIYAIASYMHNDNAVDIEVYDSSADTWSTLPPMPTARLAFHTEVVDGKLYVIGGDSDKVIGATEVYDPSKDTWTKLACMPKNCANRFGNFQTEVVDGKIYVMGVSNIDEKSFLEVYNPSSNTWTTLSSMSTTPVNVTYNTEVVHGKIYAIGCGLDCNFDFDYPNKSDYKIITLAEVYDPSTDTWSTLPPIPTARIGYNTEVIGGKIYVIGGADYDVDSHVRAITSTEAYDPSKNTWTTLAPTKSVIGDTAVIDRTIYAIGGNSDGMTMEAYTVNANDKNKQK